MSTMSLTPMRSGYQKSTSVMVATTNVVAGGMAGGASAGTVGSGLAKTLPLQRPILAAHSGRKQRVSYSNYVVPVTTTSGTVLRRNARERNRVKQVNHGFAALRNHVPSAAKNKKISKVETLRRAVEYIQALQAILDETDPASSTTETVSASKLTSVTGMCSTPTQPGERRDTKEDIVSCTDSTNSRHLSPQTLTPHSVSSVDSGFVDASPAFYMSPRDVSPAIADSQTTRCGVHAPTSGQSSLRAQHCSQVQSNSRNMPASCVGECIYPSKLQTLPESLAKSLVSPMYSSSEAASPTPSYSSADTPLASTSCSQVDGIGFPEDDYEPLYPQDEELLDAIAWWQTSQ